MKRFVIFLKETLPFWIIILVSTLALNTTIAAINAASFCKTGLIGPTKDMHHLQDLYDYLMNCNVFSVISNVFSFSDFMLYGSFFVLEMVIVLAIFKFMYKATGSGNVFSRLPFKQADTEIFTYIIGVAIIIINTFACACIGITSFLIKINELLDYYVEQSWIVNNNSASFYTFYHFRPAFSMYFLLLAYILVLFTVVYIFKMIFKQEIVGMIIAVIALDYTLINYLYSFINPADESWQIEEKTNLLLILFVVGIGVLLLLIRNIDYSKHKLVNYPFVLYGAVSLTLVSKTVKLISTHAFIPAEFDFYLVIAIVIGIIIFALYKSKKSPNARPFASVGNVSYSKNHLLKNLWIKYLVIIAMVTFILIGISEIRTISGYVSVIKDTLIFNRSILNSFEFKNNCSYEIANSFQNMNAKLMIVLLLYKLVTFLSKSKGLTEKNELLPIKKRTLFTNKYLADLFYIAIPILFTCLMNYIKINKIASLYPIDVTHALNTYHLMIVYVGLYYFTFNAVIVSFINFADVSISDSVIKIIFAMLEIACFCVLYAAIQIFFNVQNVMDEVLYYSPDVLNKLNGIPVSFIVCIVLSAILFLLSFLVCKTSLSGGMFRYKQARYVTIFLILLLLTLSILLTSAAIWQYVLGGLAIVALAILLLQNKKPLLR